MALVNASALSAINTEFDALFNAAYSDAPTIYQQLAMTVKSNTATSVHSWLLGIPGVREWVGPRHIHDMQGVGLSITNKTWENTYAFKKSDVEDDQVGLLAPAISMLGYNTKTHPDQLLVDKIIANDAAYDGVAMFASTHAWQGRTGVTNDGSLGLDATNFAWTKAQLRKIVGRSGAAGQAALLRGAKFQLIVGPDLEDAALQIVGAATNNFGAENIYKNMAEIIVLEDLVDANAGRWYVAISNSPIKPFIFQTRTGDELTELSDLRDENVFMRREFLYGWESRYELENGLWQLIYRQGS